MMKHILIIERLLQSSKLSSVRQYMWNLWVNGFLMSYVVPIGIRRFCLNCMGANVKGSLHGHCTILTNKLKLAENSFINRNCFIDNNADVSIGQNCAVGYNVFFLHLIILLDVMIDGGNYYLSLLWLMMVVG